MAELLQNRRLAVYHIRPFDASRNRPFFDTYSSAFSAFQTIMSVSVVWLVNFRSGLQEHLWKHALLQPTSEMILSQQWTSVGYFFPKERFIGERPVLLSYNKVENG